MSNKKIALITGANKGIGLETARQLGKKGITVLLGARDIQKGKTAADELAKEGIDAHPIAIDVSDPESVKKAAAQVERDFGRLDILVNNAGIMTDEKDKKVSEQSLATWRETFETNFFGLIATTNAFLALLRKSEAGRIVNLSSILGSITFHSTPGSPVYESKNYASYNVSKSAVNAYTVQLAYELKDTKIKVNAAHPGWVKTEMGGEGAMMEIEDGAKTSVALATIGPDGPNGAYMHMGEPLPW
ncbi:MAG TPA: SDR family oxidoreductase [Chthoniobacterales bacterium]|jgi:NAD(P)-dependent dehydrogenase (short-subunit alcohol dehydrogenase family)|nr:SDR family oxidoreductase [Chthoniobacterales bacterium]